MLWRSLGLLSIALTSLLAEDVQIRTIERSVIEERFGRLQQDNVARGSMLREIFAEAGCSEGFEEQSVKRSKLPNLLCTLPGASERTIVVSAHYDKAPAGQGAIDNWSGAALLPSLYQSLSDVPRYSTFVFVLFTDEEKGLIGSRSFVDRLSRAQRGSIVADVNLDSVGLPGAIHVWNTRANAELLNAAAVVASSLKIGLQGFSFNNSADSDSHPFYNERIPVIDFHSLSQKTISLLHTSKDVPAAIDGPTYYDTYRLVSVLLAYLDARHTE